MYMNKYVIRSLLVGVLPLRCGLGWGLHANGDYMRLWLGFRVGF